MKTLLVALACLLVSISHTHAYINPRETAAEAHISTATPIFEERGGTMYIPSWCTEALLPPVVLFLIYMLSDAKQEHLPDLGKPLRDFIKCVVEQ